jgi:hypothetical protein
MNKIQGRVTKKLPMTEGTKKNGETWQKNGFVIETDDKYPKSVAISCFGKLVPDVASLAIGDYVVVEFGVESREWQDKWFTDVVLRDFSVQKNDAKPLPKTAPIETRGTETDNDPLPF